MKQLFSIREEVLLSQADQSEKELQQFIYDNWEGLFSQQFNLIAKEFTIKGTVHPSGSSGRIDILAYNPITNRIVIFELKKDYDKNVGHQAADYRNFILRNFAAICLDAIQTHDVELPNKSEINDKEIEIVIIAKKFNSLQVGSAKTDPLITLIEYNWFENDLILFDYVINAPAIKTKTTSKSNDTDSPKPFSWLEKMASKGWDFNVSRMKSAEFRKKLQGILLTKENIGQLKELVEQAPTRRAILRRVLEKFEAGDLG